MNTFKVGAAVIDVILSLPQVEINHTDGYHFFDFCIGFAYLDMFGDSFCGIIEDFIEIVRFTGILYFNDDELVF